MFQEAGIRRTTLTLIPHSVYKFSDHFLSVEIKPLLQYIGVVLNLRVCVEIIGTSKVYEYIYFTKGGGKTMICDAFCFRILSNLHFLITWLLLDLIDVIQVFALSLSK